MLKEILDRVLADFPDWALLALALWGWGKRCKRRRRKYKRSDGRREDA